MTAHLAEISAMVDPGAHAVVILDQAGWHMSRALAVPQNITLLALPPRSPELNPVENIWQYLRENWLSNRVFESYVTSARHRQGLTGDDALRDRRHSRPARQAARGA
jgi:transposase